MIRTAQLLVEAVSFIIYTGANRCFVEDFLSDWHIDDEDRMVVGTINGMITLVNGSHVIKNRSGQIEVLSKVEFDAHFIDTTPAKVGNEPLEGADAPVTGNEAATSGTEGGPSA